jgi:hypothetical protein
MELRTDRLLAALRADPAGVLARIDADPLLVKRTSGDLVLANASKLLFTPQEPHQLYAKGIVYRRDPYELVSLPLLKIYNLGERNVTAADIAGLVADVGDSSLHFLRKLDGTLVQRFRHAGRAWFTTRGVIEGSAVAGPQDEDAPPRLSHFDFLGTARRVAAARYPALVGDAPALDRLTLVFEFLHPETQVITNYGDREDLVLLAAFDRDAVRYLTYRELQRLAADHGLTAVDAYRPAGHTLPEQIDALLASLAGTDQEGTVLTLERADEVIYRAKVKSPDYLRVLRLLVTCTFARTAEMADAHPEWAGWADCEAHLRALGKDQVPEEVLGFYREHYDRYVAYLADLDRLVRYGVAAAAELRAWLGPGDDPRAARKRFAGLATRRPHPGLLFAAFDGRLDRAVARRAFPTPDEAAEAVAAVGAYNP